MTTQHTPGPWEASFVAERFIIHYTPGHGVGKSPPHGGVD